MPELPEVQTVVDTLKPRLLGMRITRLTVSRTDVIRPSGFDFAAAISGQAVKSIERRAKRIVFTLHTGNRFFIHLGMSGQLTLHAIEDFQKKHTHVIFDLESGQQVRFIDPRRFGGVFWLGQQPDDDSIGPEPLNIRALTLGKRLSTTHRAVKTALLDQKLIAGIGNIYADESLWAARIHPQTPASSLDVQQVMLLTRSIKSILRRAIRAGGSTLRDYVNGNGDKGSYQSRHRVYDRADQPCPRCQTPIHRIVLGGRSTHFCPTCQSIG